MWLHQKRRYSMIDTSGVWQIATLQKLYRNFLPYFLSTVLPLWWNGNLSNPFFQLEKCFRNTSFPAVITMMEYLLSSKWEITSFNNSPGKILEITALNCTYQQSISTSKVLYILHRTECKWFHWSNAKSRNMLKLAWTSFCLVLGGGLTHFLCPKPLRMWIVESWITVFTYVSHGQFCLENISVAH